MRKRRQARREEQGQWVGDSKWTKKHSFWLRGETPCPNSRSSLGKGEQWKCEEEGSLRLLSFNPELIILKPEMTSMP